VVEMTTQKLKLMGCGLTMYTKQT